SSDERHATLFRAIDWSWRLLTPWQRFALAQLSVFEASFGIDDAQAIVALPDPRRSDPDAADAPTVLDALHALARQSLARVVPPGDDEGTHFSLFDVVREFASRHLDPNDARTLRERHARWFIARGRDAAEAMDARGSIEGMRRLDRDRADLTAILRR